MGEKITPTNFANSRKRPELLFLNDSTLSAVGLESFSVGGLVVTKKVLLLELKRGAFPIGNTEMNYAAEYIQAIRACGLLDGQPRVRAFGVGHSIAPGTEPIRKLGEDNYAITQAVRYTQLTWAADKRLFQQRQKLKPRYSDEEPISPELREILKEPAHNDLF